MGKKQVVKASGEIVAQGSFIDDNLDDAFPEYPGREESWRAEHVPVEVEVLPANPAAEKQEQAIVQLSQFELTIGTQNLLDRAIENIMSSNTANLTNMSSRADMESRIALLKSADGDLSIAVQCLVEVHDSKDVPGEVKGLLFTILKAATFLANIDYRRALDPNSEFDYGLYCPISSKGEDGRDKYDADFRQFLVDRREETSPLDGLTGHATRMEMQLEEMQHLYGRDFLEIQDAVVSSLQDLQLFFQLTAESVGWWDSNPIPYMVVVNDPEAPKPTFTPITSAIEALDTQEIKFKVAREKRDRKRDVTRIEAAKRASAIIAEQLAKRRKTTA